MKTDTKPAAKKKPSASPKRHYRRKEVGAAEAILQALGQVQTALTLVYTSRLDGPVIEQLETARTAILAAARAAKAELDE